MSIDVRCHTCGCDIRISDRRAQANEKHYCSRACRKTGGMKACAHCGKRFYTSPARMAAKFCSRECARTASRVIRVCKHCGTDFRRLGGGDYCSRECSGKARTIYMASTCQTCGMPVREPRKFCSPECHDMFQGRNKDSFICKTCGKKFFLSKSVSAQRSPAYCSLKCRSACPDWKRNAIIAGNLKQQNQKGPNRLEVAGYSLLDTIGTPYEKQVLLADRFTVDAFVPAVNLVIQWDGDYWHGYRAPDDETPLSKRQQRRKPLDASQDAYLTKHGFTVLRFWEHEVHKSPGDVVARVLDALRSLAPAEDIDLFGDIPTLEDLLGDIPA